MKILLITPMYPILGRNDLYVDTKAIHYFAKEWAAQGHDVLVIHNYVHPFKSALNNKNIFDSFNACHTSTSSLDLVDILLIENQFIFPKQRTLRRWQIRRISKIINKVLKLKKFTPDVIISHFPTYFPNLMDSFSGDICKIGVLHNTDITTIKKNGLKNLKSSVFKKYNSIFYRSLRIKNDFNSLTIESDKEEFIVNSGYPDYLIPKEMPQRSYNSTFKMLFVGKLIKLKNVDIILNSLKRIENHLNYEFTIIGSGPEKNNILKLIDKLKLNDKVQLIEKVPRENVVKQMLASDIFIMVSKPETLGLVYLEAMGCGCITIGTKNEGIDGILNHGYNGYLVDVDAEFELDKILLEISQMNRCELTRVSNNSMDTAKRYTESKVAMDYLNNIVRVMME